MTSMLCAEGDSLAAAYDLNGTSMLVVFNTKSWNSTTPMRLPSSLSGDKNNRDYRGGFLRSSSDGRLFAGFNIQSLRTGSGKEYASTIVVVDTRDGKVPVERNVDGELRDLRFTKDQQAILALVTLDEEWVNDNNRSESSWRLLRINVASGKIDFDFSGRAAGLPKEDWFSPSGDFVSFDGKIWNVEALEGLELLRTNGLSLFEQRKWSDARRHLATFLLDPTAQQMWWRFANEYPSLWGRCFDTYVAESRNEEAERLLDYCDDKSITVDPTSEEGQKVLEQIRRRQAEERQRLVNEQQQKDAAELAEFRSKNQRTRVRASQLTKSEFIQELRNTFTRGRIDDTVTYAIFENYAFQDRIGEPDKNIGLPGSDRYFVYRCRDGNVGITVFVTNDMVVLSGLDTS
ncbi:MULTISPECIES: hypothetical protein [Pirellulaceae]|nr:MULTISPECIES: hypothetical protein [Pirellulaceae]